jgi:hypothetical protein
LKSWDNGKTADENKQLFSWVPGLPFLPEKEEEIRRSLGDRLTPSKADHIMNSLKEVHFWLNKGGCLSRPNEAPSGVDVTMWRSAYDLRPDVPYPER